MTQAAALVPRTPSEESRDRGAGGRERIVVVGAGPAAQDAARLLDGAPWRVLRTPTPPGGRPAEELDGASVIVLDAASGDGSGDGEDAAQVFQRIAAAAPRAALLVLANPEAPWPGFEALPPPRPRVVPVPLTRETLLGALDAALVYRNLLEENRVLRRELRAATRLEAWVGCSAEAAAVRGAITTAAFSEGPVRILGEPGAGRRLAAELVHRLSRRSSQAFVPFTGAGVPRGELGPVLADIRRAAEDADRGAGTAGLPALLRGRPGSVYVSGADELAPTDQAVLEDALRRPQPFRLLASFDPASRAAGDRASQPLRGGRPEAFTIRIAPLRARREDVPALTLHFLSAACRDAGVGPWGVSQATMEAYAAHHWPGNAAELRMWVERAVATAAVCRFEGSVLPDGVCSPPDGPLPAPSGVGSKPLKAVLARIERSIIERTLRRAGGNQKRTAALLQVNPTTLHEKMKRHGLLRAPKRRDPAPDE